MNVSQLVSKGELIRQPNGEFVHQSLLIQETQRPTQNNSSVRPKEGASMLKHLPGWFITSLLVIAISWVLITVGVHYTILGGIFSAICAGSQDKAGCETAKRYKELENEPSQRATTRPPPATVYTPPTYPTYRVDQRIMTAPAPQRGSMPTVDCQARGGYRTINPTTGRPSCFVPGG